MLKIAVTGSTGLVGSRIVEILKDDFEFIPLIYPRFDLTNRDNVHDNLKDIDFDIFLHLAAYTNVDDAEKEKRVARKVNVEGTRNVFTQVQDRGKKFIYISTGFIFDGTHPPYFEDSKPHPLGYYAKTKYEGEKIVKNKAMIVRLEYPYRAQFEHRKDFVRTIKSLMEQGQEIPAVTDILITPTFIDDVAYGLKFLMNNYEEKIFHLVGADSLSPYNAAKLIAKIFHLDESLVKPEVAEEYFANKALRPRFAEIKSKNNNFYKMKTFAEGLKFIHNHA